MCFPLSSGIWKVKVANLDAKLATVTLRPFEDCGKHET